ncbi:MAG: alkaline phosphatase family protein [Chloroflexota bacterium]
MENRGKVYMIGIDQMVLPLTKHLVAEGCVPNLAKLLENSSTYQALSSFPCYTPNNWQSIATGANTGTHGVLSWFVHMPDGEDVPSLGSLGVNAETMWEAAERQGLKSAVVHYPGTAPSRLKNGYVVNGLAGPVFGGCPFEIATAEVYTTASDVENQSVQTVQLSPATGWKGLPSEGGPIPLATAITVTAKENRNNRTWQALFLGGAAGYDRVVICQEKDVSTAVADSRLGQWSEWAYVPWEGVDSTLRFKLVDIAPDASAMRLYRSQIMPTSGFSEPDEIGTELVKEIGPFQEHVSQLFDVLGVVDVDTCMEEGDYQAQWLAKAALYLTKEKGCDLFFCHWHFLDDVNHYHLAHVDPTYFRYDPAKAEEHWVIIRQAYQAIDRMVETLMAGVGPDDYVMLISDHGCSPINRSVFMERFLFEKEFLVFKDPETPKTALVRNWYDKIDMETSKVWLHEGAFLDTFNIFVNAPRGSAEYKAIQRDLLRELRTWVDPKTQQTVAALALSRRDAEILGLWGDQLADVVVVLEANSQLAKREGTVPVDDNMENLAAGHARMMPTEESVYGTQKAMFTIAGPGIKKGYERPAEKLGHIKLIDVAPTLSDLLGILPPLQSQGTVIQDLREGREVARERPNPTPDYEPTKRYKQWLQRFWDERFGIMSEDVVPC